MTNKPLVFDFSNPDLYVPVYLPLLHDNNRTKLLYGGRGSAKSVFAVQRKVIKCLQMPPGKFKCLMTRKMKEDVKESIYRTLVDIITDWGLADYFRFYEGVPKIICKANGNSFLPKGLNSTSGKSGTAKSVRNPTDAIVDEADEMTLEEYIKFTGSLRGSDQIEEILIFNPPEDDHWLITTFFPPKEQFEVADGTHTYIKSIVANTTILHTTHLHNPFLTEQERWGYIMLKDTHPEYYATECLGLLQETKTGGEALKKFDKVKHVSDECVFNPERIALACWDFNRRPHHTLGIWQFWHDTSEGENGVFYADLVQEFAIRELSVREVTKEAIDWLREKEYQLKTVRLIGDHSGTKQIDVDIETFIAKIERALKNAGFDVLNETAGNPRVLSSLEFLNDIFGGFIYLDDQSNFPGVKIQIRINPQCKFHIADFAKTKVGKDGKILKITKKFIVKDGAESKSVTEEIRGHGVDETRYMAVGVFEEEYKQFRKRD